MNYDLFARIRHAAARGWHAAIARAESKARCHVVVIQT